MNLGIIGGTFDPIHNAHLFIAEEARVRFARDRVLFIPNAVPPHKQDESVSDSASRLRMVELAVEANPWFECSRIEIERPGPSYAVDTLTELRRHEPDAELYFVTGMDTLAEIPTWHRPDEVIRLAQFIVAERPGCSWAEVMTELPVDLVQRVRRMATHNLEISSTDIRRRVQQHLPIRYLTPDSVVQFIADNGLYR